MAVLGSTMDGSYEPVQEICAELDRYEQQSGVSVPVHVDAASGGFIAPFIQPDLVWDFRLERVVSIQASGHKFGLVYPGRRLGAVARGASSCRRSWCST